MILISNVDTMKECVHCLYYKHYNLNEYAVHQARETETTSGVQKIYDMKINLSFAKLEEKLLAKY